MAVNLDRIKKVCRKKFSAEFKIKVFIAALKEYFCKCF